VGVECGDIPTPLGYNRGMPTFTVEQVRAARAPAREDDMHVGRAFELLKDSAVKAEIETRGPRGSLDEALET
jgi:hypothetical protein